ncbi:MAG: hypothetical protein IJY14_01850 [Acholeplasmatales bacterium]|nr:hypothetical protein [Acholeplasmatales bacterium]
MFFVIGMISVFLCLLILIMDLYLNVANPNKIYLVIYIMILGLFIGITGILFLMLG